MVEQAVDAYIKLHLEGYGHFLSRKRQAHIPAGFKPTKLNRFLKPFQAHIVDWSINLGRAAIFAACGLGKTLMQLEWARQVHEYTDKPVLILAPLAVAKQTQREGKKFGISVMVARDQSQVVNGINVTNYEMLHHFDASKFIGIVTDESSLLKNFAGAFRNQIISSFQATPYKLACTATPSPNDYMELGNHSEFLGIRSRTAMLATYFTHDGGETSKWRLKRHAEKDYWHDIASWAVMLERPSDLGFSDEGYLLPPIDRQFHVVPTKPQKGVLFARAAATLAERRESKSISVEARIEIARKLVGADDKQQWLLWGNLNTEATAAAHAIDAIEVAGSDSPEYKEDAFLGFASGKYKDLVTKYKIGGWGMNWQNCARMVHLSLTDSYEAMHQGESRCLRFGQKQKVESHIIITDRDDAVVQNIERKRKQHHEMREEVVNAIKKYHD